MVKASRAALATMCWGSGTHRTAEPVVARVVEAPVVALAALAEWVVPVATREALAGAGARWGGVATAAASARMVA